jgi:hypothetical protein
VSAHLDDLCPRDIDQDYVHGQHVDVVADHGWHRDRVGIAIEWGKGCRYPLHFHYRYTIRRAQYMGDNYRFGGVCGTDSRSIAAANPVGKRLAVHYRPRDPAQSVIVPGGGSYLFGMISLAMYDRRVRRKAKTAS